MPYHIQPLRFAIDDWHQAANAKSNNDPSLVIRVTNFVNSDILVGVRLQVLHPQYGVLFSCLTRADGRLVGNDLNSGISTEQILKALSQLGFDIIFKEHPRVTENTLVFLQGAKECGYTHIRRATKIITFKGCILPTHKDIIICFNADKRPEFVQQHIPPIKTFGGDIMQVSPNENPNLDFSWLTVPMEIESVLRSG